ncbi:VOC family protein [Pseudothauera rhizosphaerae]|uniref:VOC family protein n=1 Tax=Pseudothauera rhizosphaerae TaxID=2565932 RepID=A0A4V3WAT4_9RHOO|nr:VOC family protein [Pseudothauera rhizosphaerae]THF60534.1 VOC family protein [Pseudothauera rhizosphaerae]
MKIDSLDHLVLTVENLDASIAFYTQVLGMEAITFGEGRRALVFGRQKINLHPASAPIRPHARRPLAGSADLCFLTSTPLEEVAAQLEACGVAVEEGPVPRTGATGPIRSVYCRDPDGNLVEIANPARMA